MYTANRTLVINSNYCLECIFTPTGNTIYVLEQLMVHALITSGRYDTEVINSARIFSLFFFSILCRAARVVEEPAEATTTSGK